MEKKNYTEITLRPTHSKELMGTKTQTRLGTKFYTAPKETLAKDKS